MEIEGLMHACNARECRRQFSKQSDPCKHKRNIKYNRVKYKEASLFSNNYARHLIYVQSFESMATQLYVQKTWKQLFFYRRFRNFIFLKIIINNSDFTKKKCRFCKLFVHLYKFSLYFFDFYMIFFIKFSYKDRKTKQKLIYWIY